MRSEVLVKATMLLLAVSALTGCSSVSYKLERVRQRKQFEQFMEIADEALCYNDATFFGDTLMDSVYDRNTILIDYDKMSVGFLFNSIGDEFYKYTLTEGEELSGNVQAVAPLHSPGVTLTTFYPDEERHHRTCAVQIETEDGKFYTIEDIVEDGTDYPMFLGLSEGMTPGEEEKTWEELCGKPRGYSPYGVISHD